MGTSKKRAAPGDPKQIFLNADNFCEAAKMLNAATPENPSVIAPACAVAALATELLLKSLITDEGLNVVPHSHDLKRLYGLIELATKIEIEAQWDELMKLPEMAERLEKNPSHKLELGACLTASKDAFEHYRHIYEPLRHVAFTVGSLPHLLRHIILTMHPEWRPS